MQVKLRNATDQDALGNYAVTDRFRVADAVGQTAVTLAPTIYKFASASGPVSLLINSAKLAIGLPALARQLTNVWQHLPSNERSGTVVSAGQTSYLQYDTRITGVTDLGKPSVWADLVGEKRMTILVQSPYGSVEFGVNANSDCERVVTPRGVRDGLDPNDGNQHLHRWGEGGYWAGYDTNDSPAVVAFRDGNFHLLFRARDGSNSVRRLISSDGLQWTAAPQLDTGFATSGGPCPVVYGDELNVLYRDPNGNGIFQTSMSLDGVHFRSGSYIGADCDGVPSAAEFTHDLVAVFRRPNDTPVWWARWHPQFPGGSWSNGDTGMRTSASPCIVSFGGVLHLFYRDAHGDGVMHAVSTDGMHWNGAGHIDDYTCSNGPRAVVYKDQLKLFFQDARGNGILGVTSNDGYTFKPETDWYLGLNTRADFSAACLNGTRVCLTVIDPNGNGVITHVPELTPV